MTTTLTPPKTAEKAKGSWRRKAGSIAAAAALSIAALGGSAGVSLAQAEPAAASSTWDRAAYHINCNIRGVGCHKALRIYSWGSIQDICSNYDCTSFANYKSHPSPSSIRSYWRVIRY